MSVSSLTVDFKIDLKSIVCSYFYFYYFNCFCFRYHIYSMDCLAELFQKQPDKHLKLANYFIRDLVAQRLIKRKLVRYVRFIIDGRF